jgi:ABC-type transport system involved in multi-copper enzyme maturation permease subunit
LNLSKIFFTGSSKKKRIHVNKILTIAHITIKEELRNKVVYILLVIAFLLLFMARGCAPGKISIEKGLISPDQITTMGLVFTFNCILFWGLSLCALLAMNTIPRELVEETVILTITKPIKRSWFLLGKFLGVLCLVFINLVVLSAGFIELNIFSGLAVSFLNFILIISLIFLFSLLLPRVISALLTFTIYSISLGLGILFYFEKIRDRFEPSLSTKLLHYLLPQFGGLHLYASSFITDFFPSSMAFWSVLDVSGYIIVVWLIMVLIFQRKAI